MSDTFALTTTWSVVPQTTTAGEAAPTGRISFEKTIKRKLSQTVHLDANGAESVSLGDLATTGAHVVIVTTRDNIRVNLTLTSAAGTSQVVTAHTWIAITPDQPYTALSLTRQTDTATVAAVTFLQF